MKLTKAISVIEHLYSLSTSNSEAWSVIRAALLKVQKPVKQRKLNICPACTEDKVLIAAYSKGVKTITCTMCDGSGKKPTNLSLDCYGISVNSESGKISKLQKNL